MKNGMGKCDGTHFHFVSFCSVDFICFGNLSPSVSVLLTKMRINFDSFLMETKLHNDAKQNQKLRSLIRMRSNHLEGKMEKEKQRLIISFVKEKFRGIYFEAIFCLLKEFFTLLGDWFRCSDLCSLYLSFENKIVMPEVLAAVACWKCTDEPAFYGWINQTMLTFHVSFFISRRKTKLIYYQSVFVSETSE